MLTADELAYMRGTQEDAQPDTVEVFPFSRTSDGMGGWTDGYPADPTATVTGRIATLTDEVPTNLADQFGQAQPYKVTLPTSLDVKAGDRLRVNGKTYQAVSNGEPGEWATAQGVLARLV